MNVFMLLLTIAILTFLSLLYTRASNFLYVDHMDGFKALVHWL